MAMESAVIWMDGKLVPFEKATVHFLTPALHYGAAVFEGLRCYPTPKGPAIFRAEEHAERLLDSAKAFGFNTPRWGSSEIVEAFRKTVRANGFEECYIRPLLYAASGGANLSATTMELALGIAAWEWKNFLGKAACEGGIRAQVSSYTRHHPNVTMTKAKISGNYANSILAKTESVRLGFDEAIMLDPSGLVAECTGENLFIARRDTLFTTPTATVLEGITRASLLELAADLGIKVKERPISRDMLYVADEVFVCGSAAEVVALNEIDHRKIGEGGMGPIARALQKAYHDTVRGLGARSKDWLTPIS